jgi:hypothetical protein
MRARRTATRIGAIAAAAAIAVGASAVQAGAATYRVTNTSDALPGSLRAAISAANLSPGPDVVRFAIPGNGVHEIRTAGPLTISDPLAIQGFSQPGARPATADAPAAPRIVIDAPELADALRIATDDSEVRGLVIHGAYNSPTGGAAAAVDIEGDRNRVAGNFIGTDVTGMLSAPGNEVGVEVSGEDNEIGGDTPEERNVIAGSGRGVSVASGSGNLIRGNLVGTDATGAQALGSGGGVWLLSPRNVVGGAAPAAGNTLANGGYGVWIGQDGDGNALQGNRIGTDAEGTAALGNVVGIEIEGGDDNLIGGSEPGAGNLISGNAFDGVQIEQSAELDSAHRNRIEGNLIGTDVTGADPLPNGTAFSSPGIAVMGDSGDNVVGGIGPGAGNVIAYNSGDGVAPLGGSDNAILGNSIFENGSLDDELGIDLEDDGVTENDPPPDLDADAGANERQNYPEILSETLSGDRLTVRWRLDSLATTTFRVEFFGNRVCDHSGWGEGERFLGAETVTTDASGHVEGAFVASGAADVPFVTATATVSEGALEPGGLPLIPLQGDRSTSEFSPCFNDLVR